MCARNILTGMKVLQKRVDTQTQEIADLKAQVSILEQKVQALSGRGSAKRQMKKQNLATNTQSSTETDQATPPT